MGFSGKHYFPASHTSSTPLSLMPPLPLSIFYHLLMFCLPLYMHSHYQKGTPMVVGWQTGWQRQAVAAALEEEAYSQTWWWAATLRPSWHFGLSSLPLWPGQWLSSGLASGCGGLTAAGVREVTLWRQTGTGPRLKQQAASHLRASCPCLLHAHLPSKADRAGGEQSFLPSQSPMALYPCLPIAGLFQANSILPNITGDRHLHASLYLGTKWGWTCSSHLYHLLYLTCICPSAHLERNDRQWRWSGVSYLFGQTAGNRFSTQPLPALL